MSNENFEEVKASSNYVKFNKVEDFVKGTLIEVIPSDGSLDKYGNKRATIYVLRTESGKWWGGQKDDNTGNYIIDDQPTEAQADEEWRVTGNKFVDGYMKDIKVGQKIIIRMIELRKSKKGYPAKIIKVFAGPMDQAVLDEQAQAKQAEEEWNNS